MAPAEVPDLVAKRPILARMELARSHREGRKPLRPERLRPDSEREVQFRALGDAASREDRVVSGRACEMEIAPSEGHMETWEHFGITAAAIVDAVSAL